MSAASGNPRPTARNLLAQLDPSEFKLLRVAIRRKNIQSMGPPLPMERDIDDPVKIVSSVHYRKDVERAPIFGNGIRVNQELAPPPHAEKRFVLNEASERTARGSRNYASRSKSRSPRRGSSGSSRSRGDKDKERERSRSRETRRDFPKEKHRSGRSRSPERSNRDKGRSRWGTRSPTPLRPGEYRPNHPDLKLRYRRRSRSKDRHYDGRRSKSPTPLRAGEYRPNHPDLKRRQERRSRSPRDRSLSKERTVKPSTSRRSPSVHKTTRKYSRSPSRQKSPKTRRSSPGRHSSRPRSKTPSKHDREERRSRSPHRSRGRKGSPARDKYHRRSRSPTRYERRRSRSPYSKRSYSYRRGSRSPDRKTMKSYSEQQMMTPEYAFYDPYWMPMGPMGPGLMPRFYPPGLVPRAPFHLRPRVPFHQYPRALFNPRPPLITSAPVVPPTVTKQNAPIIVTPEATEESSGNSGNKEAAIINDVTINEVTSDKDAKK